MFVQVRTDFGFNKMVCFHRKLKPFLSLCFKGILYPLIPIGNLIFLLLIFSQPELLFRGKVVPKVFSHNVDIRLNKRMNKILVEGKNSGDSEQNHIKDTEKINKLSQTENNSNKIEKSINKAANVPTKYIYIVSNPGKIFGVDFFQASMF